MTQGLKVGVRFSYQTKDQRDTGQDGMRHHLISHLKETLSAPSIHLTQDMIQKDAHAFSPSLNMMNVTNKILYELRTRPAAQTLATSKVSMSTPGDTPNI